MACKGCSQSFSYTVFRGRHIDTCPQLQPLRRLLEAPPVGGLAGGPTGAAAAGAAHCGNSRGPGSYVAPAPHGGGRGQGAGAAPRNGGGGSAEAAALANFGGASACARGTPGLGAAGVPKDARSGVAFPGAAQLGVAAPPGMSSLSEVFTLALGWASGARPRRLVAWVS